MTIFNELDFRMSVVKRWSVVSTIRQQSIAEHSFNVAIMADRIARKWFGIEDEKRLYCILRRALDHDALESITGDFPTYMKRFVDETGAAQEFAADMTENVDLSVHDEMDRVIVKIADYIDAMIFLRMEISHGNLSVRNHLNEMEKRFASYLEKSVQKFMVAHISNRYAHDVIDGLFGGNGQFQSELYGFTKDES